MKKLGIYARQSVEKETSGSIDDQIKQGIAKAVELGISYEVYKDEGESAAFDTLKNRPSFERMLFDILEGQITDVFVYDESRLSRNKKTFHEIMERFVEFKVIVYTKIEGIIDYSNPEQELLSGIKNLFNVKYVKDTSNKIKGVLLNNAIAGKGGGGATMAFGWTTDQNKYLVHDKEEIAIYLQMVRWCIGGWGSQRIANELNNRKIPTKGSKLYRNGINPKNPITGLVTHISQENILWSPNTVLSILKNTLYNGRRLYKGNFYPVPIVLDDHRWNELQQAIKRNSKTSQRNNKKHFYMLRGLLRCAKCGRNLYGYVKEAPKKKQNVYMCSSKRPSVKYCGLVNINIFKLENLIWSYVSDSEFFIKKIVSEFQRKDIVCQLLNLDNEKNQLIKTLNHIKGRRKKRIDLYECGGITKEEFLEKEKMSETERKDIGTQLEILMSKIEMLNNASINYEKLIEFGVKVCSQIQSYSPLQKSKAFLELINEITVDFDEITKRHIVKCFFKFESLLQTPQEFFLSVNGESNFVPKKMNLNLFNDKFNNQQHILWEKYDREQINWREKVEEVIATEGHR